MIYCAEINDKNTVVRVVVAESCAWCADNLGGDWLETRRDGSIRGCFAGPGYAYDQVEDAFAPPETSQANP